MPCTITCFIAILILIAMIIMTGFVSMDPFIQDYQRKLSPELKGVYENIVRERSTIYFNGYMIGFVLSIFVILFNLNVLKSKIPTSGMVCIVITVSFIVNYFYYFLSPKSDYMLNHITQASDKDAWMKMYSKMQYYYHISFVNLFY